MLNITVNVWLIVLLFFGYGEQKPVKKTIPPQQSDKSKTFLKQNISATDSLVSAMKTKSISLDLLLLINKNIDDREKLLKELEKDINRTNYDIFVLKQYVRDLNTELFDIKEEYAKMVYYAYKTRNSYERMIYVLSAKSFNQSYKRLKFLRYYSEFRKKQAHRIMQSKNHLALKIDTLSKKFTLEKKILSSLRNEKHNLTEAKQKKSEILTLLKENQNKLLEDNELNNTLTQKLEGELVTHIETDVEERGRAVKAISFKEKRLPDKIIEKDFEKNKGKLPWPVDGGVVYNPFGIRPHPVFEHVMIQNNGIDISVNPNGVAYAVFKGVVKKVIAIPGNNQAVLISHGDFYTVYANLSEVYVKPGSSIKIREKVGKIYTDIEEANLTALQFQIWYKTQKINPLDWLFDRGK